MYSEFLRGVEHELMLCLPTGPGRTVRLLFFRGSGPDFSERDRALLALLRPHLREAYLDAERRRRGRAPCRFPGAGGKRVAEQAVRVPGAGGQPDDPGVAAEPRLLPPGEPPGREDGLRPGLILRALPGEEPQHLRIAEGAAGGP